MSNTLRKVLPKSVLFIPSLLFLLLNSCSFSSKEYYTTKGENRFTAQLMETRRKALEKQLSKQITSSLTVEIELLDSFKVGDSLIKKAGFTNDETLNVQWWEASKSLEKQVKKLPLPSSSIILQSNGKIWLGYMTDSFTITWELIIPLFGMYSKQESQFFTNKFKHY